MARGEGKWGVVYRSTESAYQRWSAEEAGRIRLGLQGACLRILATYTVLALCFLVAPAFGQTPSDASAAPPLAVQIFQDGQLVSVSVSDQGARRTASVTLKRKPFELRFPSAFWSGDNGDSPVQVAVSDEADFANLLKVDAPSSETPYFRRMTEFALPLVFKGELLSAGRKPDAEGYGHNYLEPDMLDGTHAEYRSLHVTRLEDRDDERDWMAGDRPVTMIVYVDRALGPPPKRDKYGILDWIDHREVEILQIRFAD